MFFLSHVFIIIRLWKRDNSTHNRDAWPGCGHAWPGYGHGVDEGMAGFAAAKSEKVQYVELLFCL